MQRPSVQVLHSAAPHQSLHGRLHCHHIIRGNKFQTCQIRGHSVEEGNSGGQVLLLSGLQSHSSLRNQSSSLTVASGIQWQSKQPYRSLRIGSPHQRSLAYLVNSWIYQHCILLQDLCLVYDVDVLVYEVTPMRVETRSVATSADGWVCRAA